MLTKTTEALNLVPCCYSYVLYFCKDLYIVHILQQLINLKIFIIKIQKYLLFKFLVLNAVFITVYHVKAIQDDISAKLFPSDCITVYCLHGKMLNNLVPLYTSIN